MIRAWIIGLVTGFVISIPVGPINVSVVNTFIRRDFRSAFAIAVGGSLMDFIYFMVLLSGLSLFHFSSLTILILKIAGIFFLCAFGLRELFIKKENFRVNEVVERKAPTLIGFFLLGVTIYSSNPTLVATMSGLAAVIRSWGLFANNFNNYVVVSLGLALGSASWFYLLLKIVERYQNKIPERFFIYFSRSSGALVVLLSLYMALNVIRSGGA